MFSDHRQAGVKEETVSSDFRRCVSPRLTRPQTQNSSIAGWLNTSLPPPPPPLVLQVWFFTCSQTNALINDAHSGDRCLLFREWKK